MARLTTIELQKENMKFSAGHFTIFSATEREPLHGHNYTLAVALETEVIDNGLSYDYRFYKDKLYQLCRELNATFLLPEFSDYLEITTENNYYRVKFDNEVLWFLQKDAKILPIKNTTVEELSHLILQRLLQDQQELTDHNIRGILVKVFSGPGQSGSASWKQ